MRVELSRRRRRPVLVVLIVGLVACSSSSPVAVPSAGTVPVGTLAPALPATTGITLADSTSTTVSPAPSTTAPPAPSTTAAPVATLPCTPTDGVLTTASGRHVLVRANGAAPGSPLVLILHGYTGTPTGIERYAEFTAMANAVSVVVAYPEGTPIVEFDGFGWATGSSIFSTSGLDDAGAVVEMLDAVIATGCVDPSRITIAGESNGAAMSLVAVCDARLRDRIANLVMVIPAVDDGVLAHCAPDGRPLPMSVVAGLKDRTAPLASPSRAGSASSLIM